MADSTTGTRSPVDPDVTVVNASNAELRAELSYRNVASTPPQAYVTRALNALLATLDEADVPIAMRAEHAKAALRRLRERITRPGPDPLGGSSGRPEPDLAGVLAAMALRLGEELHTLGEICDAAGMTRRSPNEIAGWLLYGDRS